MSSSAKKIRDPIPKWIRDRYGRYAPQAYVCLNRNKRTMAATWVWFKKKQNALKQLKIEKYGKQLDIDF